jgi:Na+-translocating ferredoxin:NAD+ oxidoreductase subunit B
MDIFEELRDILDSHPSGAPASPAFGEILRILFSPEEAALAVRMSFAPMPPARIARLAEVDAAAALVRLETMADRGVLYSRGQGESIEYGLVPTIPGLYEFPFMKKNPPQKARLAALWKQYHDEGMGRSFAGDPTPLMRVVPVDKALRFENKVMPYEEVADLIGRASYCAQAACACRESMERCDKPRDVCLFFDKPARALVDRGFAREVSAEDAIRILDRAEEAGLVHTTNNSSDRATVICSCCPCCCTVLRGRTELNLPHAFAPSSWIAEVLAEECNGCGICAKERCPVKAIEMVGEVATIHRDRCIGCGLCVSACPVDAMRLLARDPAPEVPDSVVGMGLTVVAEKGKLERFMSVMNRAREE